MGRHPDEHGATLLLVMGMLMILSGLCAGLLQLTTQSLRIGSRQVSDQRRELSADAAVNLALQLARSDRSVAAFGTDCASRTIVVDGITVTVACSTLTTINQVDRTLGFSALIDGRVRLTGQVVLRDSAVANGDTPIDVRSWRTRTL